MQNNKDYDIIKLKIQFYSYMVSKFLIRIYTIMVLYYSLDIKLAIILIILNMIILPIIISKTHTLNRTIKTVEMVKAFIKTFDNKNKGDKKWVLYFLL